MSKKIVGATVGTPIKPSTLENKLKPVKTVNGVAPDEKGNVAIEVPNGGDEVVISSEAPTDENAKVWINPDEEDSGGLMIVTTTEIEGDTVCIPSHGSAEINEHIINGGAAILIHNKRFYYPYQVTSKYVFFRHIFAMGSRNIIYTMTVRDEYPGYDHPVALPSSSDYHVVNVPTAEVGQTAIVTAVDSDGRPTNWKAVDYQPRTHYKVTVELFNATLTGLSLGEVLMEGFSMQAGETYYVTWNGVEYTCVCTETPESDGAACHIGNEAAFGGEDTGEPFCILYGTENGVNWLTIAVAMDTVDEAAVVIKGTGYIPIPTPYLTNAFPYYVEVSGNGTTEDPYVCNETYAEIVNIYKSGREIKLRRSTDTEFLIYNLNRSLGVGIVFIAPGLAKLGNDYLIVGANEDGSCIIENNLD